MTSFVDFFFKQDPHRPLEFLGLVLVVIAWSLIAVNMPFNGYVMQAIASFVWIIWAYKKRVYFVAMLNTFLMMAALVAITNIP